MESDPWREVFRNDALVQARAVATTIAAMEFDMQLVAAGHEQHPGDVESLPGPYIVLVKNEDWDDIRDVVDEILEEQNEFDELFESRERRRMQIQRIQLIVLTIAGIIIATIVSWSWFKRPQP